MVAYSFQKRFAPGIQDGTKPHTIRADRKRHAHVGEPLQLYCGMRSKHCFKIVDDPVCQRIHDIVIILGAHHIKRVLIDRVESMDLSMRLDLPLGLVDNFAISDGFRDSKDMHEFWRASHEPGVFRGKLIGWGDWPLAGVDLP